VGQVIVSDASYGSSRSRQFALAVLCTGMLMIVLDQTIVNVALPSIQGDLGFPQATLAWVVNAYLIAFGGLLLLAGRLGDLIGRKRMFLIGLAERTLKQCRTSFVAPHSIGLLTAYASLLVIG
jgi:MFS family permease